MALPKLPGYSFESNIGRDKFHKSHHFDITNEVPVNVSERKDGIGGNPHALQDLKKRNSRIPQGEGSALPSWVAFDKQVLCFDGFFQETVVERREEQYRVRPVKIMFYLEDDSVQVVEPRLKNSELAQGTLVKRHRIPKPAPHEDEWYTVDDFNIGNELFFYGRKYKIVGCDEFTHNFLRRLGVNVGQYQPVPEDPYMKYRKALDESMTPLRPYERKDTLKQFLNHDRHVLRFFAVWDDRSSMFGDVHRLEVHYFLADDTVEILEVLPPNSGRDKVPMFLRRCRLPKDVPPLPKPGEMADRTVLNVFGPLGRGSRYILDPLKTGEKVVDYYRDSDLRIGAVLNAFGRKVLLIDADDFTRAHYATKYCVNDMPAIQYETPAAPAKSRDYPPYTGFGSEEDSLSSCKGMLPKPPQKDFVKFILKDRRGFESNTLRYLARLITDKPIDKTRRFIISYFLSDDTILIYEPPIRNSGVQGGKFLERQRIKKPFGASYSTQPSEYYMATDLFVGAQISLNSFVFELYDADEYAFAYMEKSPEYFPMADMHRIMARLAPCLVANRDAVWTSFIQMDPSNQGIVSYGAMRNFLNQLMNESGFSEHELVTLARCYARVEASVFTSKQDVVALLQQQLRRQNFDLHGNRIYERLVQEDVSKCGFLPPDNLIRIFKSCRVPVDISLISALFETNKCIGKNENGCIDYRELVACLDWKGCGLPVTTKDTSVCESSFVPSSDGKTQYDRINVEYRRLLADCGLAEPQPGTQEATPQ